MLSMKRWMNIRVALLLAVWPAVAQESTTFRIPRIEGLNADGSAADWGAGGFRVDLVLSPDGKALPSEDFDVRFRLAWDEDGLYSLVFVQDDIPMEHENTSRLWRMDSVEFFVSGGTARNERFQLVVSSGADSKFGALRGHLYDRRSEKLKKIPLEYEAASVVNGHSAIIETFFPWTSLGIEAGYDRTCAFQLIANDEDGDGEGLRIAWFPSYESVGDPDKMYPLKLSDGADDPIVLHCDRRIKKGEYLIDIMGTAPLAGKVAAVRLGESRVERIPLSLKEGRSCASFRFSVPQELDSWPPVCVDIDGDRMVDYEAMPFLKDILEDYVRALGGRGALAEISTRSGHGAYKRDWEAPGAGIPFEAAAALPDKWLVVIRGEDWLEKNGSDGETGWAQDRDRIQEIGSLKQSIVGWWLSPQGPLRLEEHYPDLILRKKILRKNRPCFVVETAGHEQTKHSLEFDAQTGLLDRIDGRWEFEDYRSSDGVLFPFRLVIDGRRGFFLKDMSRNPDLDEKIFSRPSTAEEFADAFEGLEESKVLPLLKIDGLVSGHEEMNVPCRDGRFLYDLILEKKYRRGLEIGTFTGYSALWMGSAFQQTGGKIHTIEIDPSYARLARANFGKAGLEGVIDSRINDAFKEIPLMKGEFDLIFLDADKNDYSGYFKLLKDRLASGGAFVAHNVTNYARDMKDFLDAVKNDPDFETSFHTISAEGFSLSIKRK
jgi:caffeoyl-CoA O-methyltransferase